MMEISSKNSSSYPQQRIPIWKAVTLSILLTGLTLVGIASVSESFENDSHSTTKFFLEAPVSYNRRRLRSTKNKIRHRRTSDETGQIQPFTLKDHRTDSQHLQEILYFLNHL